MGFETKGPGRRQLLRRRETIEILIVLRGWKDKKKILEDRITMKKEG